MTAVVPRRTFLFVQALRGLAAAWVVLFHIGTGRQCLDGITPHLPEWLTYVVFDYGIAGVAVFFVLSGFVISHSLGGTDMDGAAFARFVARRSLRLDPPYWASIALTVAVGLLYARFKGEAYAAPGGGAVLAHVLYLQELLRVPGIQAVYWTLTYEVQFYLVLATAWWAIGALVRRGVATGPARMAVLGPLGALAFLAAAVARDWAWHGLFVNLWHGFFLGVLAYQAGVRRRALPLMLALVIVTLIGAARTGAMLGLPFALTALVLVVAARTGYLDRGLGGRGWQFLGRISYSLYLIHVPLMLLGFGAWARFAGSGTAADVAGLLTVTGGLVLSATVFWWLVERPSHALSARLFRKRV